MIEMILFIFLIFFQGIVCEDTCVIGKDEKCQKQPCLLYGYDNDKNEIEYVGDITCIDGDAERMKGIVFTFTGNGGIGKSTIIGMINDKDGNVPYFPVGEPDYCGTTFQYEFSSCGKGRIDDSNFFCFDTPGYGAGTCDKETVDDKKRSVHTFPSVSISDVLIHVVSGNYISFFSNLNLIYWMREFLQQSKKDDLPFPEYFVIVNNMRPHSCKEDTDFKILNGNSVKGLEGMVMKASRDDENIKGFLDLFKKVYYITIPYVEETCPGYEKAMNEFEKVLRDIKDNVTPTLLGVKLEIAKAIISDINNGKHLAHEFIEKISTNLYNYFFEFGKNESTRLLDDLKKKNRYYMCVNLDNLCSQIYSDVLKKLDIDKYRFFNDPIEKEKLKDQINNFIESRKGKIYKECIDSSYTIPVHSSSISSYLNDLATGGGRCGSRKDEIIESIIIKYNSGLYFKVIGWSASSFDKVIGCVDGLCHRDHSIFGCSSNNHCHRGSECVGQHSVQTYGGDGMVKLSLEGNSDFIFEIDETKIIWEGGIKGKVITEKEGKIISVISNPTYVTDYVDWKKYVCVGNFADSIKVKYIGEIK